MAETVLNNVLRTMYGAPDNDPPNSANIANPVLHQQAGGTGTFEDPVSFASDPKDFAPGTKIYVPDLQKYFIMEDNCAHAMQNPSDQLQVDLWTGGGPGIDAAKLLQIEFGDTNENSTIIANPNAGHPVNTTPLDQPAMIAGSGGTYAQAPAPTPQIPTPAPQAPEAAPAAPQDHGHYGHSGGGDFAGGNFHVHHHDWTFG
jgi:hypothetical protein